MTIYNNTYSSVEPPAIEITNSKVFIASNIEEVTREVEERTELVYSYTLTEYDKDEYIMIMAQNNADVAALQEELHAAKILLGVE